MSRHIALSKALESEFTADRTAVFEERPAFSQFPGLTIASVSPERAAGRIDMRPELVRNSAYNRIHGSTIELRVDYLRSGIGEHCKFSDNPVRSANGSVEWCRSRARR